MLADNNRRNQTPSFPMSREQHLVEQPLAEILRGVTANLIGQLTVRNCLALSSSTSDDFDGGSHVGRPTRIVEAEPGHMHPLLTYE